MNQERSWRNFLAAGQCAVAHRMVDKHCFSVDLSARDCGTGCSDGKSSLARFVPAPVGADRCAGSDV